MSESSHEIVTRFRAEGVDGVISANASIIGQLQSLKNEGTTYGASVTDLSQGMRDNMGATNAMTRGYRGMYSEIRNNNQVMIQSASVMRGVGSIGRELTSMVSAYNTSQIRMNTAQANLTASTQDVSYWQNVYNKYLNEFGADSADAQKAQLKLTAALASQKNAQNEVISAQTSMNFMYVTFALQAPNFISQIIYIALAWERVAAAIGVAGGLSNYIAGSSIVTALTGAAGAGGATGAVVAGAGIAAAPAALLTGLYAVHAAYPEAQTNIRKAQQIIGYGGTAAPAGWNMPAAFGAEGGIISKPTLLVAGESGSEALVPLNKLHSGSGSNIIANITQNNNITKIADAEEAADKAYQRILSNLKQQSFGG